MPELPEVENARRRASRVLRGRRIAQVATVDDRIVYAGVRPRDFAAALSGRRVERVGRKGKLTTEEGVCLAMPDPRRFGRIRLQQEPERESPLRDLGFDPLLALPTA